MRSPHSCSRARAAEELEEQRRMDELLRRQRTEEEDEMRAVSEHKALTRRLANDEWAKDHERRLKELREEEERRAAAASALAAQAAHAHAMMLDRQKRLDAEQRALRNRDLTQRREFEQAEARRMAAAKARREAATRAMREEQQRRRDAIERAKRADARRARKQLRESARESSEATARRAALRARAAEQQRRRVEHHRQQTEQTKSEVKARLGMETDRNLQDHQRALNRAAEAQRKHAAKEMHEGREAQRRLVLARKKENSESRDFARSIKHAFEDEMRRKAAEAALLKESERRAAEEWEAENARWDAEIALQVEAQVVERARQAARDLAQVRGAVSEQVEIKMDEKGNLKEEDKVRPTTPPRTDRERAKRSIFGAGPVPTIDEDWEPEEGSPGRPFW